MIVIKKHFCIRELKRQWESIEAEGGVHVFQTYEMQSRLFLRLPLYLIPQRKYPVYYEICDDGKTVMILPLCKSICKAEYSGIGPFQGMAKYDFVFSRQLTAEKIRYYLQYFMNEVRCKKVSICGSYADSRAFLALKSIGLSENVSSLDYVDIPLERSFEDYFSGLSKNARQNIRTAYNRLQTDSVEMRFEMFSGNEISFSLFKKLMRIYCDRHEKRYRNRVSFLKKIYLKYIDFSSAYLTESRHGVHCVLFLNNKPAAFLSGYHDEVDGRICVPRLSVSDEYRRYSPGVILINETAKKMINECQIYHLDLEIGTEKYKMDMGGSVYPVMNYDLIKAGDNMA